MVGVRNDYLLQCFDLSTGTAEKVKIRKCCFKVHGRCSNCD